MRHIFQNLIVITGGILALRPVSETNKRESTIGANLLTMPLNGTMDRFFDAQDGLYIRQSQRGCIQELFGATANNEFFVHSWNDDDGIGTSFFRSQFNARRGPGVCLICGPFLPLVLPSSR